MGYSSDLILNDTPFSEKETGLLDDLAIEAAAPRSKPYKLTIGNALHVLVSPTGCKTFRWKYRIRRREQLLTIGRHPHISVVEAMRRVEVARQLLADGDDPGLCRPAKVEDAPISLADMPPPPIASQKVYFIQVLSGHIKIGTSANVTNRLRIFNQAHPEPVNLLAAVPGGHVHEAEVHRMFRRDRDQGEWFSPSPELLAFIDAINAEGGWPC